MILDLHRSACLCAGYYGASESQTFSEASSSGRDYLAEVCRDWEAEAQRSTAKRNVILRTGATPKLQNRPSCHEQRPGRALQNSGRLQQLL